MQRKATKQSPAANAKEKAFMAWVKAQGCAICGNHGVVVDHMYGATFKHNKVAVGHWALLPLCISCDSVKTHGSHNAYKLAFGGTQSQTWLKQLAKVPEGLMPPQNVVNAIRDWGR